MGGVYRSRKGRLGTMNFDKTFNLIESRSSSKHEIAFGAPRHDERLQITAVSTTDLKHVTKNRMSNHGLQALVSESVTNCALRHPWGRSASANRAIGVEQLKQKTHHKWAGFSECLCEKP